ncbi:MAG: TrmO family methyltransferase domain-containing protein [Pseudobdellovibrionaceae bacterium]
MQAIGIYYSEQKYPYEAGRQPEDSFQGGVIVLKNEMNLALQDLLAWDYLWIIFEFHHNKNWKPLVQPPVGSDKKIGVLATRSPYRPNALGLSLVKINKTPNCNLEVASAAKVEHDTKSPKIFLLANDLLDGWPIFDIKPFVWEHDTPAEIKNLLLSNQPELLKQPWMLSLNSGWKKQEAQRQLQHQPTDGQRKRIWPAKPGEAGQQVWILAYRTWRVNYVVNGLHVVVESIFSGYSEKDLLNEEDKYTDKNTHRDFLQTFS